MNWSQKCPRSIPTILPPLRRGGISLLPHTGLLRLIPSDQPQPPLSESSTSPLRNPGIVDSWRSSSPLGVYFLFWEIETTFRFLKCVLRTSAYLPFGHRSLCYSGALPKVWPCAYHQTRAPPDTALRPPLHVVPSVNLITSCLGPVLCQYKCFERNALKINLKCL